MIMTTGPDVNLGPQVALSFSLVLHELMTNATKYGAGRDAVLGPCRSAPMPPAAGAQTTTVTLPGEVRTYVLEQKMPSVTFEGDLDVGTSLPDTVEIDTIPTSPNTAMSS